jgi:hypothetical protein
MSKTVYQQVEQHAQFICSGHWIPNHPGNIYTKNQKTTEGTEPAKGHTDSGNVLQIKKHKGPDWVDEEQNDADGVRHTFGLAEGSPEAT